MQRQPFWLLLFITHILHASSWQSVAPGIAYKDLATDIPTPWSHVHVFKVSLKQNTLELVMAKSLHKSAASAADFAEYSKALIAINGGFFDQDHKPLGLRIQQHIKLNTIKNISWWGIFYIQHNKPYITDLSQQKNFTASEFAIQSGPRLIINGLIPQLKPGYAERTALGINKNGDIILLVTENFPITTTELATILQGPSIQCVNAINLDGGSSSQLYANIGMLKINHQGYAKVSDAIIVKTRKIG